MMSIQDVELRLEKALGEALATRRALSRRVAEGEEELRTLRRRLAEMEAVVKHTEAALGRVDGLSEEQSHPTGSSAAGASAPQRESTAPELRPALPAYEKPPGYEKPPLRTDINPSSLRFRDLNATQAATIVLRECGQPLHVNAIYNTLLENGFEFGGDHPIISLSVALNRSKRFRKVAPATFDLVMRDVQGSRASVSG